MLRGREAYAMMIPPRPITRRRLGGGAVRAVNAGTVDVALVLAIDGSGSVTDDVLAAQRSGHAGAVASPGFVQAVRRGPRGRAAVAVIEWASRGQQSVTVPWTVIAALDDAEAVAGRILAARTPLPGNTSISGAIDAATVLFARLGAEAERRVLDISANGISNDGRSVADARAAALAAGITINGLAIVDIDPELDRYLAREVIGGPGAFVVRARDAQSYRAAILRKMLTEVAGGGLREPSA
jgi:hypothetical protein